MLTPKQERFALNLFSGMSQRRAWVEAGYSSKYAAPVIDTNACMLAHKNKIKIRLAELNAQATSLLVASEIERKERLSEVLRGKHRKPVTAKEVVGAIAELNKMERLYEEVLPVSDNRTINIYIQGDKAKEKLKRLLAGEKPQLEEGDAKGTS